MFIIMKDKTPAKFSQCPFALDVHHVGRQNARQLLPTLAIFQQRLFAWNAHFLKDKTLIVFPSVHFVQTLTVLKDKTLAIFRTRVHSLQKFTLSKDNTLAIFLCASAYLLQMLTLVNDKTLATFEPVSILFKLSPC